MSTTNLLDKIRNQAKQFQPANADSGIDFTTISVNPQKNLPSFEEITPYKESTVHKELNSGERVGMFDQYIPGANNYELAAQSQTSGEKWWNGIQKAVGKTGTAVIGGTAGVINGIGAAISDGSLTALYDNDFNRTLDDWNTKMDYQLPNYYTEQEAQKGFFGQLGTANFWSDKVLGGLSFTAGAIISEGMWAYATGGASLGARAARWGTKTLGAERTALGVAKYSSLLKKPLSIAYSTENVAKNTAIALGRTGDLANTLRFTITSAGYEASVESLQYRKEQQELFNENFFNQNGRQPTIDEVNEFNQNLEKSANAVFGANLALVGSSNLVQMGKIFDLKNPINLGVADFIERKAFARGVERTAEGVYDVLKPTRLQKIARNVYYYGKSPVSEGIFEEGLQGVTSGSAGKWLQYSYDPQKAKENLDLTGAIFESLGEQYGTSEGWVENGVGMIIGALGGTVNARQEMNAANSRLDFETAGLNTFTEKALSEKFLSLSRVNSFAEEQAREEQNGNLVKARMAKEGMFHTRFNYAYQLGQNFDEVVDEARTALNATTVEQFNEAGIRTEEIEDYKASAIAQYEEMGRQFRKNRKYAEYIIGRGDYVGVDEVYNTGDEALKTNNAEALTQALTYTLTVGESAANFKNEITNRLNSELGAERAKTINTISQLRAQEATTQNQITQIVSAQQKLEEERQSLQNTLMEIQSAPNETEGDVTTGQQYAAVAQRLLEVNNQLTDLQSQLQEFADNINSQQERQSNLNNLTISTDDLVNLESDIKIFEKLVDSYKQSNPQQFVYLNQLIKEFEDAQELETQNKATAQALTSGRLKLKDISTFLGRKVRAGQSMDEFTRDWLVDTLQNYQNNRIVSGAAQQNEEIEEQEYTEFVDNNTVTPERLNSLASKISNGQVFTPRELAIFQARTQDVENILKETPAPPAAPSNTPLTAPSEVEALKEQLNSALKNNMISSVEFGDKPTQQDIEQYRENPTQELRDKLGNWRLLNSIPAQGDMTVADLIEIIEQLETQTSQEDVKDEILPEDVSAIAQSNKDGVSNTTIRYDLAQNTKANATAQFLRDKKQVKLSHIRLQSIIDSLSIPLERIKVQLPNNKGQLVTAKTSQKLISEAPIGAVFTLDNMRIEIGAGRTLIMNESDFTSNATALNLLVVIPINNWSYFDLYEVSNGQYRKRPSDFEEDIDPSKLYLVKPGDELSIRIADDAYNQELRRRLETNGLNEELEKDIEKSLKLYVVRSGVNVSVMKATSSLAPSPEFLEMRRAAKQAFIDGTAFSAKISAKKIFLGSPEVTLDEAGNIVFNPISAENVTKVISTGYLQNGQLNLSREVADIDLTYTSGIKNDGKKLPVIIFKKGAYNVAYPVSLNKSANPQAESILQIVNNPSLTEPQKIKAINQRILETGIATDKKLSVYDENKIQEIVNDFSQNETFVSMEDFSNQNYRLQNLTADVSINIDLGNIDQVISVPKLEVDLSSIAVTNIKAAKYEELTDVENRLSDLYIELRNDYTQNAATKYLDSRGNIIEDTHFTNVFDEGRGFLNPQSQLDRKANVNALREALSEPLPASLKKVLDLQVISDIKSLLKREQLINSQTTPNRENSQEIIDRNSCK